MLDYCRLTLGTVCAIYSGGISRLKHFLEEMLNHYVYEDTRALILPHGSPRWRKFENVPSIYRRMLGRQDSSLSLLCHVFCLKHQKLFTLHATVPLTGFRWILEQEMGQLLKTCLLNCFLYWSLRFIFSQFCVWNGFSAEWIQSQFSLSLSCFSFVSFLSQTSQSQRRGRSLQRSDGRRRPNIWVSGNKEWADMQLRRRRVPPGVGVGKVYTNSFHWSTLLQILKENVFFCRN